MKHTKPLPKLITIGKKYKPAMIIIDAKEAQRYFEKLVAHSMLHGNSREEAEKIEKSNLGYFAGYYGDDVRKKVEQLFFCVHPIFGAASNDTPTAAEAFELGKKLAESSKKE